MYELFYRFLIDELLVRYFEQTPIEAGDKYYIMIEDKDLRQQFYDALNMSDHIHRETFCFSDTEGFSDNTKEFECPVIDANSTVKILISGCDYNTDGFQTKIRNSVGMADNPLSDMAVLFILPGKLRCGLNSSGIWRRSDDYADSKPPEMAVGQPCRQTAVDFARTYGTYGAGDVGELYRMVSNGRGAQIPQGRQ